MDTTSYKSGTFLTYQLLDALYRGDLQSGADSAQELYNWCTDNYTALNVQTAFLSLYDPLEKLMRRLDASETVSMREYNGLRAPLVEQLANWIDNVKIRLFLQDGTPSPVSLGVRKEFSATVVKGSYGMIPDASDDSIHVLLAATPETLEDTTGKIDAIITVHELFGRARYCFPVDIFDYDRLYLSGKLQSLSSSRNDVSVVLGGSSYAMVGFREDLMPRPATNLAVNAQDPYFAFLAAETAKKACKKIDAVVIAGGYYFWHTDMSDNPSDYYKSVLTRVNYPILKSLHNYKGEMLSPMQQSQSDPFMEKIFDFQRLCEKENNKISARLATLAYYNAEINPRPANGMLQYPFREQSDEINDKAAKTRAQAHNGNFNLKHLEDNMRILSNFLLQMKKKHVRVILLVPPVTKFYRPYSMPELRETLYEALEQVKKEFEFTFLDLFDSPDFDVFDFQDYDHLNAIGAEKLSKLVAGLI